MQLKRSTAKLLVHNAGSGNPNEDLPADHFPDFESVTIEDAADAIRAARDAGTLETVAVWGGDGTMRSIAELVAGTDVALLAGPGGTHNHFALDLGLDSLDAVDAALGHGKPRRVDVGMAADHVFLNNANVGWYVELVAHRERLEKRIPRRLAKAAALVLQIGRSRRLHVEIDGEQAQVWMLWIGNGEFSLEPRRLAERDDPADGLLDVRLLRAGARLPKLRLFGSLVAAAVWGRDPLASPHIERRLTSRCTLRFRRDTVRFALDGELLRLPSPVVVSCRSRALRVLVPPDSEDVPERSDVSPDGL